MRGPATPCIWPGVQWQTNRGFSPSWRDSRLRSMAPALSSSLPAQRVPLLRAQRPPDQSAAKHRQRVAEIGGAAHHGHAAEAATPVSRVAGKNAGMDRDHRVNHALIAIDALLPRRVDGSRRRLPTRRLLTCMVRALPGKTILQPRAYVRPWTALPPDVPGRQRL